ncbi:MAG TPA: SIS domain-containing protein [Xanthobacteraceae bacterium]|nr:SIS domain-containing protein [Xanthobacteraceae bacterium]
MLQRAAAAQASWFDDYAGTLATVLGDGQATDRAGNRVAVDHVIRWAAEAARTAHEAGNKLIFVGNGGSATTASHMATDYNKNGNLRTMALNDGSMLTCLANDYAFEHVFAKQVEFHGVRGDILVAMSASGTSANILNAVRTARAIGCTILTMSGFAPDNTLRGEGDMNLYLPSDYYGVVEIGHLTLCHAILDFSMERDGRGPARRRV